MPYWFNVDTGQVETDDDRSQDATVMGPYDSHDAAANALETARANTERWDREDRSGTRGALVGRRVPGGLTPAQPPSAGAPRRRTCRPARTAARPRWSSAR